MTIWGIDPGAKGALAILREDGSEIEVIRFSKYEPMDLAQEINARAWECEHAWIEQVQGMRGDFVNHAFTFGKNTGWIQGVLHTNSIDFHTVTPQKWQMRFGLGRKMDKRKKAHQAKACELFNRRVVLEEADALLIALYGVKHLSVLNR